MFHGRSVLVVAAHPDDEVLGCGGTMRRISESGVRVDVMFLSDGVSSRGDVVDPIKLAERNASAVEASLILGANHPTFHTLPDNQLDTVPLLTVCKLVEAKIAECRPDTILTHFGNDVNVDHRVVSEAVTVACRPQSWSPVKRILFFEVPSSTEWRMDNGVGTFAPNYFVDISAHLGHKLDALNCYASELRDWPHPRSLKAVKDLCGWRGATVGVDAAEAFMLGREIV
jgi:LmbE family N-acetylglucosaminyl deacetylase